MSYSSNGRGGGGGSGYDRSRQAQSYHDIADDRRGGGGGGRYDDSRRSYGAGGGGGGGRDYGRGEREYGRGGYERDGPRRGGHGERERSKSPVRRKRDDEGGYSKSREYRRSASPPTRDSAGPPSRLQDPGRRMDDDDGRSGYDRRRAERHTSRGDEPVVADDPYAAPREGHGRDRDGGGWGEERHVPAPREDRGRSVSEALSTADDAADVDAAAMAAMMGFSGFDTTKAKHVQEDLSAVAVKQARTHRQYMNRKGGFNRPLDRIK